MQPIDLEREALEPPDGADTISASDRREHERFATQISVDYSSGDTFLFSYIQNISEMGIFIRTEDPLPIGTRLDLRFGDERMLEMEGEVVWVNPVRLGDNLNPGMGVRFCNLTQDLREHVVQLVRTIAYLQNDASN